MTMRTNNKVSRLWAITLASRSRGGRPIKPFIQFRNIDWSTPTACTYPMPRSLHGTVPGHSGAIRFGRSKSSAASPRKCYKGDKGGRAPAGIDISATTLAVSPS
jgi:hypothetical protein